jgi:beta-glucosidase-like glycosyl hydrolase
MRGRGPAWTGDPGGRAEGIMCAYSDLKLTNDTSGGAPVPSCASEYLLQMVLREQFQSPAVVQSDCCDSVSVHHRSFTDRLVWSLDRTAHVCWRPLNLATVSASRWVAVPTPDCDWHPSVSLSGHLRGA